LPAALKRLPSIQLIKRRHDMVTESFTFEKRTVPSANIGCFRSGNAHFKISIKRGGDGNIAHTERIACHKSLFGKMRIQEGKMFLAAQRGMLNFLLIP